MNKSWVQPLSQSQLFDKEQGLIAYAAARDLTCGHLPVLTEDQYEWLYDTLKDVFRRGVQYECLRRQNEDDADKFVRHIEEMSEIVRAWPEWKQRLLGRLSDTTIQQAI
jgi:hypothetical protein